MQIPVLRFTQLGFDLVRLIDEGYEIDYEETKRHIEDETLFEWLPTTVGGRFASLALYDAFDREHVFEVFQALVGINGSEFGVERDGLALLLAFCLEAIVELHGPRADD